MSDPSNQKPSPGLAGNSDHPHALLLDDCPCIRMLHGKVLELEGIPSFRTGSEAEAWKFLGYPEVRVFIQDFDRGPGTLGGLDFLERMLLCPTRCQIPVIVISGAGRQRIAVAIFERFKAPLEEVVFFLEKPIRSDAIEALSSTLRILIDLPKSPTNLEGADG